MTDLTLLELLQPTVGPSHHSAPKTSRQAAKDNAPRSGTQRAKVLCEIANHNGVTDEELSYFTGLNLNSIRPRRNELVNSGLVMDSGRVHTTISGSKAVRWTATLKGLELAKELT